MNGAVVHGWRWLDFQSLPAIDFVVDGWWLPVRKDKL